jgi:integrase/recombinase XerD
MPSVCLLFAQYLRQLGYTQSSLYMLPRCVADFLAFHPQTPLSAIEPVQIELFRRHLQERPHKRKGCPLSERYIHHHLYALRVFFDWLQNSGQINIHPMSGLVYRSPHSPRRQPLSLPEIHLLFAACQSRREKAMLHLFYSCGLRRSEGVALQREDVHLRSRLLYVRAGKGGKRRVVPMHEKVAAELEAYALLQREDPERKARSEGAFLLTPTGERMKGEHCNRLLQELAARAEIEKEVSLHILRHSIATHLLEKGLSVEKVRDFLGHKHLESTQIYARVSEEQLRKL